MKCLKDFLELELGILQNEGKAQDYKALLSCSGKNGLESLLLSSFIVKNPRQLTPPQTFSKNHKFIVDDCIIFLLDNKLFDNVLTYGYRIARSGHVNATLHCESTNSNVSSIKSGPWNLLHNLVGSEVFVNILINCSIFVYNGTFFKQIVGNSMNEPHVPPLWYKRMIKREQSNRKNSPISNNKFLHRAHQNFKPSKLLPRETKDLMNDIFKDFLEASTSAGKRRLRRFEILFKKAIENHQKVKHIYILNSICPALQTSTATSHQELQSAKKCVLKFVTVIIEKTFPQELFGSKRNKARLFSKIALLLNLKLNERVPSHLLTEGIKLKEISWLGKPTERIDKLEREKRQEIFEAFVHWLFEKFVPKLLYTFFYCTEVSSAIEILFFRQDVWKNMTSGFLSSYIDKHLVENSQCEIHDSYSYSNFNHGFLRLVPKKARGEFRVISVPFKGADSDELAEYRDNLRNVIKPTICVLDHIRNQTKTHFKKLYSPMQVAENLRDFKNKIREKHKSSNGEMPPLFFIKFDIASCYDSIPVKKALAIISNSLSSENEFYVRTQSLYDSRKGVFKRTSVVNGSLSPRQGDIYIDNVRTCYLSKHDIMNVLDMEINKTAIRLNKKCYLRKDGLFQGFGLSATIVDILYDDLLKHYAEFHPQDDSETLILRLSDDFLVISTDEARIKSIEKLVLNGFQEYNATINLNKIMTTSSLPLVSNVVSFCALNINMRTLEVWKSQEALNVLSSNSQSPKELYEKLKWLFNMRMSYNVANLHLNSWETILIHIENAISNVAESFINCFMGKKVTYEGFSEFIEGIIYLASCCCEVSETDVYYTELRSIILQGFLNKLSTRQSRFRNAIAVISEEKRKSLYDVGALLA